MNENMRKCVTSQLLTSVLKAFEFSQGKSLFSRRRLLRFSENISDISWKYQAIGATCVNILFDPRYCVVFCVCSDNSGEEFAR